MTFLNAIKVQHLFTSMSFVLNAIIYKKLKKYIFFNPMSFDRNFRGIIKKIYS